MEIYIKIITEDIDTLTVIRQSADKLNLTDITEDNIIPGNIHNRTLVIAADRSSLRYNSAISGLSRRTDHHLIIISEKDDAGLSEEIKTLHPSSVLFKPLEMHYVDAAILKTSYPPSDRGETFSWNSVIRAIKFSPAIILLADNSGTVKYINNEFKRATGYTYEEISHPSSCAGILPALHSSLTHAISGPASWSGEVTGFRKNGSRFTLLSAISPVKSMFDSTLGFVMFSEDITARKEMEENLERARVLSEEASVSKTRFMATISHEIRTPLNAIVGMADLALLTDDQEAILDYLIDLKTGAARLLRITEDVLDFSKLETGEVKLESAPFIPAEIATELALKYKQPADEKELQLICTTGHGTDEYYTGDAKRVAQALNNIIDNSIRFTEKGSVMIEVRLDDDTISGREMFRSISFSVTDTGMGITPEKLALIFEKFRQADETVTRLQGGTGLGLSISKKLVELMNGTIDVKSEPGRGSTFSFTIPFKSSAEPAKTEKKVLPEIQATAYKLRILIVEDNPINSKITETILKKMGHHVETARNGLLALNALKKDFFDAVFMDIEMPVLDGIEATRRIRSGEAGRDKVDIPVIAMTAHAISEYEKECIETGMNYFLTKPINIMLIPELLNRIFAENPGS